MALTRRTFLKRLGIAGATALSVPFAATGSPAPVRTGSAVEVSGRVTGPDGGIGGVAVTDGMTVTQTGDDGRFQFDAFSHQPFVYVSVPAGYKLPTDESGAAAIHRPLEPGENGRATAEFDLEPLRKSDDRHAFTFLSDPQARTEAEMEVFRTESIPDVKETATAMSDRPVFGIGGGDLVFDTLSLFPTYKNAIQESGIPFVQVVGNHDLNFQAPDDPGSTATYRRHFGPEYYSFDRGSVHYVVLDDVYWPGTDGFGQETDDYLGHIDATQLRWLEQDLALVEEGRPVVVFTHIPPLSTAYERRGEASPTVRGMIINRQALYELLDPFDAHIVTGHVHENEHRYEAGPHEHVVGAVCGAWWTGPVCYDGTPRGYAVYEVNGETIQWRYKSTHYDPEYQMRLSVTDEESSKRLLANVWDADDEWTITWYEDGVRRGQMSRDPGVDPLVQRLYAGEDQPEKHGWVEPQPTDHLFSAPYSSDAGRIRVEATDRFGRTYTSALSE